MPGTTIAKNPAGIEIVFDEAEHKYSSVIDGKEIIYTSVTTLAGRYFPKFESEKIAERVALKENVSVQEILDRWDASGKAACRFGTRVHETCEDAVLSREFRNVAETPEEAHVFKSAKTIVNKLKEKLDIVGAEYLVFDTNLQIAGTIDLLAKTSDDQYYIIDWKTNKSIDVYNRYNKKGLHPIEDLDDTNFVHYSLQLNLYEYILKSAGYINKNAKVKKMLMHLSPTTFYTKYEIADMQDSVRKIILRHILDNKNTTTTTTQQQ